MATVTVSTRGRIVLPATLRRQDGIRPGQRFSIERTASGAYRLVRTPRRPNAGLIDWLLTCPEKGFLRPVGSESTDTLPG